MSRPRPSICASVGVLLCLIGCGGSITPPPDATPEGEGPFESCPVELRIEDADHLRLGERRGGCAELGSWLAEGTLDRACLESLVRAEGAARGCVGTWLGGPRSAVVPPAVARVDSTPHETPCIVTFTVHASGEVRLEDAPLPLADLAASARGTCPGREPRALVLVDEGTDARIVEDVVGSLRRGGIEEVAVDLVRVSLPP